MNLRTVIQTASNQQITYEFMVQLLTFNGFQSAALCQAVWALVQEQKVLWRCIPSAANTLQVRLPRHV